MVCEKEAARQRFCTPPELTEVKHGRGRHERKVVVERKNETLYAMTVNFVTLSDFYHPNASVKAVPHKIASSAACFHSQNALEHYCSIMLL
jgi:hypothetical protein